MVRAGITKTYKLNKKLTGLAGDRTDDKAEGFRKSFPRFFVVDWVLLGAMFSISSSIPANSFFTSSTRKWQKHELLRVYWQQHDWK